eukprot:Protomagalhaensia_sp_Gyna_25__749@NODE_1359_length_1911_cov_13_541132_g1091_i0_p1_GENE_NODE_1359_length_1911_cov_13_541132_g1091_i0NODE_1359_length_1911_cov_13_541132_g1091_i0_p1_ORF_typecomplete_len608_score123_55Not3/PF04065_15/3_4e34SH3_1/PF00018_28/0_0059HAUS5/PF14817_6/0_0046SH3_9/PF14604_6/0_037AAA_PrkA/PF08298_11/0_048Bcl2_BAD/PF10514_9/0_11SH3_2/PF07653_17/0_1MAD/PF05557_13/0_25RRF/PF01765_19/0_22TRF/PF08558_10/0_45MIS13/PF08202_11/1_1HNF1_N/PF04814_13/5_7e03HNF1_N/PF04814_13/0_5HNF1_N/P
MSKKLSAEIEKCLRETQSNMQVYDLKWRELKCYNEATANPDWAVLGSGVIKCNAPEVVILSGLKAKRIQTGPSVITVDISNMSEKQVSEVKEKLKNELESLMKKVYRSRQQLLDWILHADLRQTGFTKEQLIDARKEIESRHRKGKVYYLKSVSSEDTSNEQASQFNEVIQWMQDYVDQLRDRSDQFTAELEGLMRKGGSGEADRIAALKGAVEMYLLHADRLDELLRGIRNNTISIHQGGDEHTDLSEEIADGGGGDGVELLLKRLAELKELLAPFVEENEDLNYYIDGDIYDELGIVAGVGKQEQDVLGAEASPTETASPARGSATAAINVVSPTKQSPVTWPSRQVTDEAATESPPNKEAPPPTGGGMAKIEVTPARTAHQHPDPLPPSSKEPKELLPVSPPQPIRSSGESVLPRPSSRGGEEISSTTTKNVSYRAVVKEVAAVKEPSPTAGQPASAALAARLRGAAGRLAAPGWSGRVVLGEGVRRDVCAVLGQLAVEAQERLLVQVEAAAAAGGDALPVLVLDAQVAVLAARRSWRTAEMPGIPSTALLPVEEGTQIEVLACVPRERWTFGRLATDKSKQGWFPTHVIQ